MSRRRLSLAGQLLALQVVVVCVVLVGVAAVTVAQSTQRAQEFEARRALSVAETLANTRAVREALAGRELEFVRVAAENARSVSGSGSVVVARSDRTVVASAEPAELGRRYDTAGSDVLQGRSWVGERRLGTGPAAVAMAPMYDSSRSEVIGLVAVTRMYPSVMDGLRAAAPNLLTYLGLASIIGIVGSLLVARRVKRQTLGLEPPEIAGLVEHREAMLHGIREGVLGLDLRGRVTMINDEAVRLLRVPGDAIGRSPAELGVSEEVRETLLSTEEERDRVVATAGRVLVINRLPISNRGRPIGSVATLRDRTELLELQQELDVTRHVTDTLRAQAHEFSNRLHTIAGLIELGRADEAVRFVHRVSSSRSEFAAAVTDVVHDPSIAALLIAKGSQAGELGIDLRIDEDTELPALDEELSTDVATVVGNLLDNAMDAASVETERWVEICLALVEREVAVVVSDSGAGVPDGMESEVFRRGMSTKEHGAGQRGLGLAQVHLLCTRRGGGVAVTGKGATTFVARLPLEAVGVAS